jgi:RNA polymerase sigma-70 factor (ECF subfamily)
LPDGELARRAAGGDRNALEVLLRRHQPLVHRVCRRLCANEADALDATQESLITIARRIDRFDGRAAFTTWMYRVTTNACLDELRRRRRRPQPAASASSSIADGRGDHALDRQVEVVEVQPDPADIAAERLDLDRALAALPVDFRAAVVLRDLLGLDYAEIAEVLGIPAGTVRSRIARGRSQLARQLEPERIGNSAATDERPTRDQFLAPQPAPEASP